jgi:hypothetical protein
MLIKIKSHDDELLAAAYQAAAAAASRTAWIELNRPLTSFAVNRPIEQQMLCPTLPGKVLMTDAVSLPIGTDIKSVTCAPGDIDNWLAYSLTFGTLNMVNPQGSNGGVNLSAFHPLAPHEDKAVPWVLSKSKVDVQVAAQLINCSYRYGGVRDLPPPAPVPVPVKKPRAKKLTVKQQKAADAEVMDYLQRRSSTLRAAEIMSTPAGRGVEAIFRGFSIQAFQEEQVCAIQTRIMPTDRLVGCAELINHFRQVTGELSGRQYVRQVQSRDPVQTKVARVATAAGNFYESVKGLFGGPLPSAPAQQAGPSYIPPPSTGFGR